MSVAGGSVDGQTGRQQKGWPVNGFGEWLSKNTQARNAVGDLARDAAADPDWPEGSDELETFTEHLEDVGASQAALDTLHQAWELYRRG